MSGLGPGMEWGCGGTEGERSDRDATHALHPPHGYQRISPPATVALLRSSMRMNAPVAWSAA
jgi:hypothetical protein